MQTQNKWTTKKQQKKYCRAQKWSCLMLITFQCIKINSGTFPDRALLRQPSSFSTGSHRTSWRADSVLWAASNAVHAAKNPLRAPLTDLLAMEWTMTTDFFTCNSWPSHSLSSPSPPSSPLFSVTFSSPLLSSPPYLPSSLPLLFLFSLFPFSIPLFFFPFLSSPLLSSTLTSPLTMSGLSWPCPKENSWPYGGNQWCNLLLSLSARVDLSRHLFNTLSTSSAPYLSSSLLANSTLLHLKRASSIATQIGWCP